MEVDVEFLKRELPMHFLELCKYQQDIIEQYQEYIENSEKIATTFKSAGIMNIPKRNK